MTNFDLEVSIAAIKEIDAEIAELQKVRAVLGNLFDRHMQAEKNFPDSGNLEIADKIQDVRYEAIDKQIAILKDTRADVLNELTVNF